MAFRSTIIIFVFAIICLLNYSSAAKPIGAVSAVVVYGEELTNKDSGADLSDPYVKLWVDGNHKKQTTVKKNTLNPYWDETFVFNFFPGSHKLHVEVWDKDYNGDNDDLMGQAVIDLDNYCIPTAAAPVCDIGGIFAEFDDTHLNYVVLDAKWHLF
ncbi:9322_t:CDS:2 [Paraglomus occultum]|uniref:9322_t:CDS:1 n=1 Tax=Paraglomus occultum TaxID=144539 RepID=A0A9N9BVM8_9GLOM|nr:9322_t:CDS:2 [Paraglomus occultum]